MKKILFAAVMTVSSFTLFANPYAGYLYPAGVKAGSMTRVLVGGQNFNGIIGGTVTGKGVRVKRVVSVPGFPLPDGSQRAWIYKWLAGIEKGKSEVNHAQSKVDIEVVHSTVLALGIRVSSVAIAVELSAA